MPALPGRSLHSAWWQHAALVARCSSQPHARQQGLSPTPGRGAGLGRSAEGCRVRFTPWLCAGMCSLLCVLTLAECMEAQPPVYLESAPHGSVTVTNGRTVALHPQTLDGWANSHSGLSPCSSCPGQAHLCFMHGIVPVLTLSWHYCWDRVSWPQDRRAFWKHLSGALPGWFPTLQGYHVGSRGVWWRAGE